MPYSRADNIDSFKTASKTPAKSGTVNNRSYIFTMRNSLPICDKVLANSSTKSGKEADKIKTA